jgi:hypothetical protein
MGGNVVGSSAITIARLQTTKYYDFTKTSNTAPVEGGMIEEERRS